MLRGPKGLTRWVDLSIHRYPENGLLAGLSGLSPQNHHLKCPKTRFIGVKRAKDKGIANLFIWGSMNTKCTMQANSNEALPMTPTPKG